MIVIPYNVVEWMVAGNRHGQRGFDGNGDHDDCGGRTILSRDEPRVGEVGCGRHNSGTRYTAVSFSGIEQFIDGVVAAFSIKISVTGGTFLRGCRLRYVPVL